MDNNVAKIVKVIDEYTVAINQGSNSNVYLNDTYVVFYKTDEEIIDPDTGEILGHLEIPVGKGKVISVQDRMSIIKSCEKSEATRTIQKQKNDFFYKNPTEITTYEPPSLLPFEDLEVGYYAKKIK